MTVRKVIRRFRQKQQICRGGGEVVTFLGTLIIITQVAVVEPNIFIADLQLFIGEHSNDDDFFPYSKT